MDFAETIQCIGFWCSAAAVVYAYLGYPILIYGLSRLFGKAAVVPSTIGAELPRVALLIAAYNEAVVIEQRIQNALQLDYPSDRLEIVVASDGSDDATPEICRKYAGRVRLLNFPARRGKAATLNAAVAQLDADIIAFSDANTFMDPAALHRLTRWFDQAEIGAVCGRLVLTDPKTGRNVDSVYWQYETFLKRCEGRLGGPLGANGAIYAIRRNLFVPLPAGTLVDDLVIPLLAKMQSKCRIVYDTDAVAFEESAPDLSGEYRRRARIGTGGFQAIAMLWPLLGPRHGWTAFSLWSHKVLRWCCPFCMIAAFLACALLAQSTLYLTLFVAQLVFYVLCGAGAIHGATRPLRVFAMFAGMNLALLIGFVRWLGQSQSGVWARTQRP
jgi:cellulose synthase/poly-beta-1,6-N-acetylglucosamine synthase-like glycosyltransferase